MARKRRTPEECVKVLREAAKHGIAETVKKHNITETTFYRWKRMYGGMELSEIQKLRQLQKENEKLKRLAADQNADDLSGDGVEHRRAGVAAVRVQVSDEVPFALVVAHRGAARHLGRQAGRMPDDDPKQHYAMQSALALVPTD